MTRLAFSLAWFNAGRSMAARMPMMEMTTSSSMSVKAVIGDGRRRCTDRCLSINLVSPDWKLHQFTIAERRSQSKPVSPKTCQEATQLANQRAKKDLNILGQPERLIGQAISQTASLGANQDDSTKETLHD